MLVIGDLLGHYRLLELLGAGGMGQVYLAMDERLGRKVAVKVLPQEAIADESARKRLLREARATYGFRFHLSTVIASSS